MTGLCHFILKMRKLRKREVIQPANKKKKKKKKKQWSTIRKIIPEPS